MRLAGGSVRAIFYDAGTGYSVEFDDGTRVGVGPFARQGLNVWVVPSAARQRQTDGTARRLRRHGREQSRHAQDDDRSAGVRELRQSLRDVREQLAPRRRRVRVRLRAG